MPNETSRSCLYFLIVFSILGILGGIAGSLVLSLDWQALETNHRYASIAYAGLSSKKSFSVHL